jgi:predicted secreted hydrolase
MRCLVLCFGMLVSAAAVAAAAPVIPGKPLSFPRDYGSHPQFRTEWWYVTGWLRTAQDETLGFQITFFRTKPDVAADNPSAFAPSQILIAHCALSDPKRGRLWQDQRIRRAGMSLAGAAENDTKVWIERWSLRHEKAGYEAHIQGDDFSLNLTMSDTQPPLLNGDRGFSRKGPDPAAASYYYSLPHMKVLGSIARQSRPLNVTGEAWFDHEWSSEYLDLKAVGWEWVGINLNDGGALMAFRIRGKDGEQRWAGGTWRDAGGRTTTFSPDQVKFKAGRIWKSLRTGVAYPVEWQITLPGRVLVLKPLFDDQENDTRLSTGAIYWEGAVSVLDAGVPRGRGYLELTGYGAPLQLR